MKLPRKIVYDWLRTLRTSCSLLSTSGGRQEAFFVTLLLLACDPPRDSSSSTGYPDGGAAFVKINSPVRQSGETLPIGHITGLYHHKLHICVVLWKSHTSLPWRSGMTAWLRQGRRLEGAVQSYEPQEVETLVGMEIKVLSSDVLSTLNELSSCLP